MKILYRIFISISISIFIMDIYTWKLYIGDYTQHQRAVLLLFMLFAYFLLFLGSVIKIYGLDFEDCNKKLG